MSDKTIFPSGLAESFFLGIAWCVGNSPTDRSESITVAKPNQKLTAKQAAFVSEFLVDGNATAAAKRSGYSAKTAKEQATRLLSNVHIAEAIAAKQAKRYAK